MKVIAALTSRIRRWRMKTHKSFGRPDPGALRLSLGDRHADRAESLAAAFRDIESVEVVEGNLLDLACDAIVSPANSFGDMSGGIDKAIDDFFSGEAQRRIMAAIAEQHLGELPVGAALIASVPGHRFSHVVAAPTMRIPGSVTGTINAYLAMRASLVAVLRHNASGHSRIHSLAVPTLCTGVGGMPCSEAAQQMRAAYDNIMGGQWRQIIHPAQAPYALPGFRFSKRS